MTEKKNIYININIFEIYFLFIFLFYLFIYYYFFIIIIFRYAIAYLRTGSYAPEFGLAAPSRSRGKQLTMGFDKTLILGQLTFY